MRPRRNIKRVIYSSRMGNSFFFFFVLTIEAFINLYIIKNHVNNYNRNMRLTKSQRIIIGVEAKRI